MKGISPLIATVFLISFTVALGLMFSNWILPLLNSQRGEIDEKNDRFSDCSGAKLFFEKKSLTANGSRVTVSVENRGNVNLTDFKLYITLNDSTFLTFDTATNYNTTLMPSQQTLLINESSINKSNITRASVSTGPNDNCPSTKWEIDYT